MNKVVSDLEGVEVYQNDLIVHGSDKVVHDERLIALLHRLIEKNITVNPNKCSFCVSSFECLGYLVDGNGFRPDMKRLAPLTNASFPKKLTELRSLVGTLQYYSRFIPNFSCRANGLFNISASDSVDEVSVPFNGKTVNINKETNRYFRCILSANLKLRFLVFVFKM
ncbi:unnamed protein product [Schistosoma margrebowiei]|uniref:Uncharacterized protein n=1 Tax=Schistosoma margrebowiei TaxID=48269 RepID=A0A183M2K0_9TREM|nr:unnamed protein product [Schistosoma margrebowiei]